MDHADVAYLASKRTVDERARNRRVRDRLLDALPPTPTVVDVGSGIGSMLRALLGWGVDSGTYLGIDRERDLLVHTREALADDLAGDDAVERTPAGLEIEAISAGFAAGDVRALPATGADLVVAQALLDLVPVEPAMAAIERALRPGGLAYLPITFDGVSRFHPAHPDDRAVLDAYHAAIDATPGRDSRAGRALLAHLGDRDGELLAVGAADWIVRPREGAYPAEEAHFVACILDYVAAAVATAEVDAADWLGARRDQLAAGELHYVAHNADLLYRAP